MNNASIQEYQARLRDALAFIAQLKGKLEVVQRAKSEPIAIVGMACRFPGGGANPEAFFRALEAGVDGIREAHAARWPADAVPAGYPEARWAGLLDGIDGFDAAFFDMAPREAESLDPQQRLLLEVAWEALEDAGQRPDLLKGSRTGVFVGLSTLDYQRLCFAQEPDKLDGYAATGNMASTAAGRLSYVLGLQGPCMAVDTACSSSLCAVHLGCQSLRQGESDLALCGGVNVILSPLNSYLMARLQALSKDGRCKTFDASANGYVRGEGCGVIALKRLGDAQRDGDRILALIRGSAVNQDGRSTGLTTPNVLSQEALLRQVLASARLSPEDIDYIESHGTGTSLGDPIEVDALRSVLGAKRPDGRPCVLGAVKTNVGHLEAAAGIAGVIKVVQALRHASIPKNLHFQMLNPRISLEDTPFVIPTKNVPWERHDKPRRAGVSSFGISGTNAHVIIEEAPLEEARAQVVQSRAHLLPLSAKSPAALRALARAYADRLVSGEDDALADIAYTASVRRTHHEHRLAVVGRTREEAADALVAFAQGQPQASASAEATSPKERPRVVFVYPGQGSQWVGMGRGLLAEEPAFRLALEACDEAIRRESGFSVLEEIASDEGRSRLSEVDVVQPLLFALQVALTALWRSWGVQPDCVVGHSMGEVAAAHVSGALDLTDAAKVICRRSRLLRRLSGKGAMALVELTMADAERALVDYEGRLSVAVSNGPRSTVLSGDEAALEELLSALAKRGVFCRRVKVDVASHSPQVDALREDLSLSLRDVRPGARALAMRSTVTGEALQGPELDARYWVKNLREPVRFSQVTRGLLAEGRTLFVEMSPHPILVPSIEENLRDTGAQGAAIGSLRRQVEERRSLLEALGTLYAQGHGVDWSKLHPEGGRTVRLPGYAWQHERYWIEGGAPGKPATAERDPLDEYAYVMEWRRKELAPERESPAHGARGGAWLLLLDGRGLGRAVAALLRERGEACVEAIVAPGYERSGPWEHRVDVTAPEHVRRLLAEAFDKQRACKGVVHFASLDGARWDETSIETLGADVRRGSLGALRLVQGLLAQGWRDVPRLFVVTRGAQGVGAEPVSVGQAPVWGLARTIALEHPDLECTRIDLPPLPLADEAARLVRELVGGDGEDQIALRQDGRHVARLVHGGVGRGALAGAGPALHANASYLIAGAFGRLGLSLARRMTERGARHLALVGRSEPDPAALAAIRAIEASGAEVRVLRADISRRADVDSVLKAVAAEMPPLRGVVHMAREQGDRPLLEMDQDELFRPMGPKVFGAWNLHEATSGLGLDWFVMYSSATGLFGSPGKAGDAAASVFLDALARARRAQGLPGMSIQWGAFSGGEPAGRGERDERASPGIGSFTPDEGAELVERLLGHPGAEVGLLRLSMRQWIESYPQASGSPMFSELEGQRAQASAPGGDSFGELVARAAVAERARLVETHLLEQLGRVLRMDATRIDRRAPFTNLGMDSLMSLELRNRLEASLGLELSAALLFTYSTPSALAAHLLQRIEAGGEAKPEPELPEALAEAPAPEPQEAPDDDLLAAFDASLRKVKTENLR
jgi:acyl transferase domain-containing protein/acyl carrier protein